jgi:hypothetical protein
MVKRNIHLALGLLQIPHAKKMQRVKPLSRSPPSSQTLDAATSYCQILPPCWDSVQTQHSRHMATH